MTKRIKTPLGFEIDCNCGFKFIADAEYAPVQVGTNYEFRQWECPHCGQLYIEKVEDLIILER